MSKTNILSLNWSIWKHLIQERKKVMIEKHSTKMFYKTLDIAIEKCKQHPRKYYIVKVNTAEWEILGSQEIRKMRKFSEARKDNDFRLLHETAPYVSPENIERYKVVQCDVRELLRSGNKGRIGDAKKGQ
jgi:hypothetical protein